MQTRRVVVFGTYDTKGEEFRYLCRAIESFGARVLSVDVGVRAPEGVQADLRVAERAPYPENCDKLECMRWNTRHLKEMLAEWIARDEADAVISMGGGQGSSMACEVFQSLPIGFPKLLLSTIANLEGSIKQFQGVNDTLVMNSIVDIAGLNDILKEEIRIAAAAIAGMAATRRETREQQSAIGITCWGVTTPCVNAVRDILEAAGYAVLVFHANGAGGAMLERLICEGRICAVADISLPEITMPLAGSDHAIVEGRLENAIARGIPMVVVPGGADMVHVTDIARIPRAYEGRKQYWHTNEVLFVRSTPEENRAFAQAIARKLEGATARVKLMLPLKGLSLEDSAGGSLYEPETDRALFQALEQALGGKIDIIRMDCDINDKAFAYRIAEELLKMMVS